MREGSRLVLSFDPAALSFYVLLELLHCFTLMFFPIADVIPLFLEGLPHPEAFECGEFRVGERV